MYEILEKHGFTHVLGDCYANDPWVSDPSFIAHTMEGSIMIIHMPERGFRDYSFQALPELLEGLSKRGLKVVTLTTLYEAAMKTGWVEFPEKLSPTSYVIPDSWHVWHGHSPGQHSYRY